MVGFAGGAADGVAISQSLWERRISMISTFHFIRQAEFGTTLTIAERLLADDEDLSHKAIGWMLREVGNRDRLAEETFLRQHHQSMRRTMRRAAIEKFPERKRLAYSKGNI